LGRVFCTLYYFIPLVFIPCFLSLFLGLSAWLLLFKSEILFHIILNFT
jgi:hypothetical protein